MKQAFLPEELKESANMIVRKMALGIWWCDNDNCERSARYLINFLPWEADWEADIALCEVCLEELEVKIREARKEKV